MNEDLYLFILKQSTMDGWMHGESNGWQFVERRKRWFFSPKHMWNAKQSYMRKTVSLPRPLWFSTFTKQEYGDIHYFYNTGFNNLGKTISNKLCHVSLLHQNKNNPRNLHFNVRILFFPKSTEKHWKWQAIHLSVISAWTPFAESGMPWKKRMLTALSATTACLRTYVRSARSLLNVTPR